MSRRRRAWVLSLFVLAMLAMILLVNSLGSLEFLGGEKLRLFHKLQDTGSITGVALSMGRELLVGMYVVGVVIALLSLPFGLLDFILSRESRRQILFSVGLLLSFFLVYLLLGRYLQEPQALEAFEQLEELTGEMTLFPSSPFANQASSWLVILTTVVVALLSAGAMVGAVVYVLRLRRNPRDVLEQLAEEAQRALVSLEEGGDFRNVVLQCYAEMSRVLLERQGIARERSMTPREFEQQLHTLELPRGQIHELTELFEAVRYGAHAPNPSDEYRATACLKAIVAFCGERG
ncbi:MAG: DUF4129 domain-containing protein [Anaerolineae bacterium]|nr:DUF4129 domain-containing protein [Anaerolineae bacterium]